MKAATSLVQQLGAFLVPVFVLMSLKLNYTRGHGHCLWQDRGLLEDSYVLSKLFFSTHCSWRVSSCLLLTLVHWSQNHLILWRFFIAFLCKKSFTLCTLYVFNISYGKDYVSWLTSFDANASKSTPYFLLKRLRCRLNEYCFRLSSGRIYSAV